ncbi:MAG: Asp-tRNA(Asn)/Glu-tRNA(Gln) amidotransferase subunit GatC [Alphaproteobacteria bacterium]|nr:Asp-tRNA(Asn)/Glu-tRNA(Gln) amidotransferase subunit GatC [Alphaproteobacteria bacterium]
MALNQETIKNLSSLSRLRLPAEREAKILGDLQSILDWVEQLKEVNIDGVEPLVSVTEGTAPMREDVVTDGGLQTELMANAPEQVQGFYVVPKVVE